MLHQMLGCVCHLSEAALMHLLQPELVAQWWQQQRPLLRERLW